MSIRSISRSVPLLLLGLPVLVSAQGYQVLPVPPLPRHREDWVIASEKDGSPRWSAIWTTEKLLLEGHPVMRFTEEGEGRHAPFPRTVRWRVEALWNAGRFFSPQRVETRFTDLSGKLLLLERSVFDSGRGRVSVVHQIAGAPARVKELEVPRDTVIREGLHVALSGVSFDSAGTVKLHLLSHEPKLYKIELKVRSKKHVRINSAGFVTYQVEMKPDMGFLNTLGFLFPKTYLWFTTEPPHSCVRYQGLETDRGSPEVTIEVAGSR